MEFNVEIVHYLNYINCVRGKTSHITLYTDLMFVRDVIMETSNRSCAI